MVKPKLVVAAAAGLLAAALAAEPVRWLNVHAQEHEDKTDVNIHVPLSLVLAVVDAVDTRSFHQGSVTLNMDKAKVDWPAILEELQKAPEGDYVTVTKPDATVRCGKKDGIVTIDVQETGRHPEHVLVKLQEPLLQAVHVEDGRLDVKGLLTRLSDARLGDLVTVESADADVRVWLE